jgi:hypothetical protein
MDLEEMGLEGVDCVNLAQEGEQWRAVVNSAMNFSLP